MRYEVLTFGLVLLLIKPGIGYRYLGLFPLPIKSHFFVFEKLMKALTERGHEVDVLTHYPQEKPIPRYNDISVAGSIPSLENNVSIADVLNMGPWEIASYTFKTSGADVCENILKQSQVEKLKNSNRKYDAIITEVFGTDCLLGFAHLFNLPIIGMTSTMQLPWGNDRMGNPDNPSYITNYFTPHKGEMILLHKIETAVITLFSKIGYHLYSTIPSEMRARDFFGNDMPPLDYIAANTSLLLVNSHFLINDPRPNVPGFIEVGGMHIEEAKPLPSNLTKIVSSAKNGIIYFSMGTVIRMDTFPKEQLEIILEAFAKLPQIVLWKGSSKDFPKSVPQNVVLIEWLPQLDILCHPKLQLFVTHGGQLSIQEALHCGVPVLGIPLFADQNLNILNYEIHGAGIRLKFSDISVTHFQRILNDLLYNDTYRRNARQLSRLFKDRPMHPVDTAIYWVEYVVRHSGALHLRTRGADLIWFELYLIDVMLVFLALFVIMTILFFNVLNIVQSYFDSQGHTAIKEKTV